MKKLIKNNKLISFGILVLFIVLRYGYSYADTHYCSTTGGTNWAASTNIATPCNLSTAFANATAGDTVYLRGGTYSAPSLSSAHNGTSGSKVTFINYSGETPVFSGAVNLTISHNYWVFNGISFTGITGIGGDSSITVEGQYDEFRNLIFTSTQVSKEGGFIDLRGSAGNSYNGYHIIDNCNFTQLGTNASPDGIQEAISIGYGQSGNGYRCHYNTVSNCTFTNMNGGYTIVVWGGSSYNQILNNTFDNNLGFSLGISVNDAAHSGASQHNLIDGNTFKNFGHHNAGNSKACIQLYGDNNSLRRNLFYDNHRQPDGSTSYAIELADGRNNLIYNNVFYNNVDNIVMINNDARTVTGNKFYNNIFWKNQTSTNPDGYEQGSQINWQFPNQTKANFESSNGSRVDYNFIQYVNTNYDPIMHFYMSNGTWLMSLTELHSNFPITTSTQHNIQATGGPGFISEVGRDFHLAAGSPCIDAGVVINDPDWGNLPYIGSAPDIGAFEYGGDSPPSPPKNLRIIP